MESITLLLWSVLSLGVTFSGALEYSNRWTVQIDGDNSEADRLAHKHGFVNQGKVIDDYYSFQHEMVQKISKLPSTYLQKGLMSEPNVKLVKQEEIKSYKLLSYVALKSYPNDTWWNKMWYINRKNGPTYNVMDVWKRNITGKGVVVAVVDEGLHFTHPEFEENYDEGASWDFVDNDTDPVPWNKSVPQYGHGDNCAGVIAAVGYNNRCGVGLAYKATLGGIRLFLKEKATDDVECKALSYKTHYIDIYSNSWGPDDSGFYVTGPGPLTQRALKNGAEKGRNGRGSIYVFAAGNGGLIVKDSCAFNGYVNSIFTIAITGINSDGAIPVYGEHCAGIMAVTYSRDIFGDSSKVITATTKDKCTDNFGASSAAAAMASGLTALMLSANPGLTWRDVQHIIVQTARSSDDVKVHWRANKVGLKVNDYVGFGLMDASKMVDAAIKWKTVPRKVNCTIRRHGINRAIPSRKKLVEKIDLSNWSDLCGDKINYLEHVEVGVNLTYTRRGDLLIKLISPQETVSNLTHFRPFDSYLNSTDLDWVLMSLHNWGENATGLWKLTLENSQLHHNNTGTLFDWTLILHGTASDPLADNPHVSKPVLPRSTDKPVTETAPTSKSTRLPSERNVLFSRKGFTPSPTRVTSSTEPDIALIFGVLFACLVVVTLAVYVGYKKCK